MKKEKRKKKKEKKKKKKKKRKKKRRKEKRREEKKRGREEKRRKEEEKRKRKEEKRRRREEKRREEKRREKKRKEHRRSAPQSGLRVGPQCVRKCAAVLVSVEQQEPNFQEFPVRSPAQEHVDIRRFAAVVALSLDLVPLELQEIPGHP